MLMILQSPLHKVNGHCASGDLTTRPLSSTMEDLGMETFLLAAKYAGTPPSNTHFDKERMPNTCRNCMECHQGLGQILSLLQSCDRILACRLSIVFPPRSFLYKLENGHVQVQIALGPRLDLLIPIVHNLMLDSSSSSSGCLSSSVTACMQSPAKFHW